MTNYNERLDEILELIGCDDDPYVILAGHEEAKQALTSLINQQVVQALSNVDIDDEGHAWYIDGKIEMRLDEYVSSLIKEYKGE